MANAKQKEALKKKAARQQAQAAKAPIRSGTVTGAVTKGTRATKPRQERVVAPRSTRTAVSQPTNSRGETQRAGAVGIRMAAQKKKVGTR